MNSNEPAVPPPAQLVQEGQGFVRGFSVPVPDGAPIPSTSSASPSGSAAGPGAGPMSAEEQAAIAAQVQKETAELVQGEKQPELVFKWGGKPPFVISVFDSDTVGDIKVCLYSVTSVPVERQKIIGLVKGKLPSDEIAVSTLNLQVKTGAKFTLIGTPEGEEAKDPGASPDVADTVDIDYSKSGSGSHPSAAAKAKKQLIAGQGKVPGEAELEDPRSNARNKRKILEMTATLELNLMNEPREGKKLLVLDLDYTLFDCKNFGTGAVNAIANARPGLQEFLTKVYPYYDICIWSQTHWRWLETKVTELGMVQNPNYNICFVLDKTCMFSIYSRRNGAIVKHEVKALEIIWRKLPGRWDAKNTVHIDDLSRNGAMNSGELLKISAFTHARSNQHDRELFYLSDYLVDIAENVDNFETLDHSQWKQRALDRAGSGDA